MFSRSLHFLLIYFLVNHLARHIEFAVERDASAVYFLVYLRISVFIKFPLCRKARFTALRIYVFASCTKLTLAPVEIFAVGKKGLLSSRDILRLLARAKPVFAVCVKRAKLAPVFCFAKL